MKKILLFGLSLIILVACGGKKQEQTPSTITESIINETIINDTIVNDVIVSDAIINNESEIAALTKQRDELLPLLMNGQVNFDLLVWIVIFARK